MSADNFVAIIKKGNRYIGYSCSASRNYNRISDYAQGHPLFTANSVEEAIRAAQKEYTEYGYIFVNLPITRVKGTVASACLK